MRRYLITLALMALLIGSLFQAADQTGVRLMAMFGTLGIFLFGVAGTLAVTRWQADAGIREVQAALKSLEPDHLITDWVHQGPERPDYLVVGPTGVMAICLDETPQSIGASRARAGLLRSRERARQAAERVGERLAHPVAAMVVLTRRRAEADFSGDGVAVLNPEELAVHIRSAPGPSLLDQRERVRLTRLLRTG